MKKIEYVKLYVSGYKCHVCGKDIAPTDPVAVCQKCEAILCKSCTESGHMDNHDCHPEDD